MPELTPSDPFATHNPKVSSDTASMEALLAKDKISPSDQKYLHSPFAKMFRRNQHDVSDALLIKEVKRAVTEYCNQISRDIKKQQEKAKKVAAMLKRVAEGKDMYE